MLVDYTKKRTIQDLTAKLAEAERTLEKTKIQSKSKLAQDDADPQIQEIGLRPGVRQEKGIRGRD